MKENNKNQKIYALIVSINIFFIIILSSLYIVSFNENFYHKQFEKNSIYEKIDASKQEIKQNFTFVLNYVKYDEFLEKEITKITEKTLFNEREIKHLKDVNYIFFIIKIIISINAFLLIIFLNLINKEFLKKSLTKSSYSILIFILLIVIFMLLDFTKSFNIMHEIIFTNDLWILDSRIDNLIIMLPEIIFVRLGIKWLIYCSILPILYITSQRIKIKKLSFFT